MSLSEFIQALGGPAAAAEIFGVTPGAVRNWLWRGALPRSVHYTAHLVAQSRDLAFDPAPRAAGRS